MSTSKKKLILNTVSVDIGCGSCKKPKLSKVFHPKTKHYKAPPYQKYNNVENNLSYYYSSSTSSKTNPSPNAYESATTFSPATDGTPPPPAGHFGWGCTKSSRGAVRGGFGRVGGESVAVEKDSDDPYLDFRHSMLQMILENEIYSKDDLKELLNCFLQLNSPYHHGIIVRAFTEIWNGVFSVKGPSSSVASPGFAAYHKPHYYGRRSRDF